MDTHLGPVCFPGIDFLGIHNKVRSKEENFKNANLEVMGSRCLLPIKKIRKNKSVKSVGYNTELYESLTSLGFDLLD